MAPADPSADGERVLLVVNGVSRFFTHRGGLALGLRDRGWRVEMVVPEDEDDSVIREAGIRTHPVPLERRSVSPVKASKTLLALAQLYEERDPGVVHHFTPKPVIYGGIAARLGGVLRDPELRRRMGRRGREIAVERFSIQRVVEKTSEVYRDLMAEAGRRSPTG